MADDMLRENEVEIHRVVKLCGIDQEGVSDLISDLLPSKNPRFFVESRIGETHIQVTAHAPGEEEAEHLAKKAVKDLKRRFGALIYTTEPEVTLEQSVIELLLNNELKVSTAESCTGGMIAARIIDVPGASEVYKEGFITYSNKAKHKRLDVKKSTLKTYGAVSAQTAEEMAKGGMLATKSEACVAATGVAGPDGGTEEKPVGLVYIGCCVMEKTTVREFRFGGDRRENRELATAAALALLRECILLYLGETKFA